MATRSTEKRELHREQRLTREQEARAAERARQLRNRVSGGVLAAIVVLAAVFVLANKGGGMGAGGGAGRYPFQVGSPSVGQAAPAIDLPSTAGGTFSLASQRGKNVLLYFQEGLTCQPCWDQLKDLQGQTGALRALGIGELVSVTSDPLGALRQKASDEGLSTPVLSDGNLAVSQSYNTNQYGMMGTSRDGHSFVLVGPDGRIRWRADYGGAPNYTMFVPVSNLLADLRKGAAAHG